MDDTPYSSTPSDRRWRVEYRLNEQPESLKEFIDLFLKKDGTYDDTRRIWTTDNTFVHLGSATVTTFEHKWFQLVLQSDDSYHSLSIHSSTLMGALDSLELLLGLHDTHFLHMRLNYRPQEFGPDSFFWVQDPLVICPLTNQLLEKMLQQSAKRKNTFYSMIFTPNHCRTLASSGRNTDIEFAIAGFKTTEKLFWRCMQRETTKLWAQPS
jgi:hypothetical protein